MYDTLTGWSRLHLVPGMSFPAQSGIFQRSYIPSLAASVMSLKGSTDSDCSPAVVSRPIREQVRELNKSIDLHDYLGSIAPIENATSDTSKLSECTSVPTFATSDRVSGMPTLKEGHGEQTIIGCLATRSLSEEEFSLAPSPRNSAVNSIAIASNMHVGSQLPTYKQISSPLGSSSQQNGVTFLPNLVSRQISETRAQKPSHKKRRRYDHYTKRDRHHVARYRHKSSNSKYRDSKSSAIAKRKAARSRRRNKRNAGDHSSTKSKCSEHHHCQRPFNEGIFRFIEQLSFLFCGLRKTTQRRN